MLYKGGHKAAKGTYWDVATGERIDVEQEQVLAGDGKRFYIKAPTAVMLLAGPVLGLIFAIFLPFIGIVMTISQVARKLGGGLAGAASQSMSFGWRPIEAYLAGRKRKKEGRERKPSEKK